MAHADDDEFSRPSLRGLKGVQVIVESLPPEVERNGLTKSAIQTDVELKLRQSAIPVFDLKIGNSSLHVSVDVLTANDGPWLYVIRVELRQPGFLTRDPSIGMPLASTWDVGTYGTTRAQNVRNLRDTVKDQVDKFINAYLAVNPKNRPAF